MSTIAKNGLLADALEDLHVLQDEGHLVFKSRAISVQRMKILKRQGYVQPIIKGWYHLSDPATRPGDTTAWTMAYWSFVRRYCDERFGDDWVLSPEVSLMIHAENRTCPKQIVIHAPKGGNNTLSLPDGRSIFDLRTQLPEAERVTVTPDGLRIYTPEATLVLMSMNCFDSQPAEVAALLGQYRSVDRLLNVIVAGSHQSAGNRLAGAFRRLGMERQAERLTDGMRRFGIQIRNDEPTAINSFGIRPGAAPISTRLRSYWDKTRAEITRIMPSPQPRRDVGEVLGQVDDVYREDAWHSLSIEGYRVTRELIDKIRAGDWKPEQDEDDRKSVDALAARGYWDAFKSVREVLERVLVDGQDLSLRDEQGQWYQQLFAPAVTAGIVRPEQIIGYRNHPVFIRTAQHVPPRSEALNDAMETYFDLVEEEEHPAVQAVLGHWLLGYIHPYPDGNGRLARFTMNCLLVAGGYDWVVIRLDERARYMKALDAASVHQDVRPFAELIADHLR
ncbi:Fic family protein [Paracoccus rhizosphaerae]|uniref:Fic family protein n=1 Tax=Paracoccus rhizosphaerae TaxID=1133347 RepID=A0ABV6CJQ3_9RHOB|nr:Fic family protein [Paracoccus rhizosphaerae]